MNERLSKILVSTKKRIYFDLFLLIFQLELRKLKKTKIKTNFKTTLQL